MSETLSVEREFVNDILTIVAEPASVRVEVCDKFGDDLQHVRRRIVVQFRIPDQEGYLSRLDSILSSHDGWDLDDLYEVGGTRKMQVEKFL